jgi:hypothetical protein
VELLFELLVPLLEFLAEIVLQVVFEWLAEFGFQAVKAPFQGGSKASPVVAVFGYAIFGAVAGGLSLLVFPSSFVASHTMRVVNLVVTPVASGALMSVLGSWRRRRGQELIRLDRFAYGMVFAFAMSVVRFVFAHHAS